MEKTIQDYENKIAELERTLKEKEREIEEKNRLWGIYRHEIGGELSSAAALTQLINYSPEKTEEYSAQIYKKIISIIESLDITHLRNISKEELEKKSSILNLEELCNENIISPLDKTMEEYKIKFELYYNGQTLIEMNKPAITNSIKTIIGNAINYANKDYPIIKQGIQINTEGDLEILTENLPAEKSRNFHGTHEGLGLPFAKDVITNIGGKFMIYPNSESRISGKKYNYVNSFGNKSQEFKQIDSGLWVVEATIPKKYLLQTSNERASCFLKD
jgi:signal transduction histidine kinase